MTHPFSDPRLRADFDDAHDFDPADPMFGLHRSELSGPALGRRTVLRLLAASGLLTAAHLVTRPSPVQAASGGHLKAAWTGAGEISTLDPARINQVLQFQIASQVLGGLTHINGDLVAEGDLARDWTVSDDGLEWTFNLHEGVTFHNGDAFTADDVLFTVERSRDPQKSIHSRVLSNVADVQKLGDHTVKFVLHAPQASFLVKTLERASGRAVTIVSRGALAEMGPAQYGLTPVGTGPFRCTFHELGQGVVLERNENYHRAGRPHLDKVTITPVSDPEPLAAAIEAGDVDLIGGANPPPELLDRFIADPDMVVDITADVGFQAVWINPHREPFRTESFDKPIEELMQEKGFMVRMALAKGLDRERYIKQAWFRPRPAGIRLDQPGDGVLLRRRPRRGQPAEVRCRGGAQAAGRCRLPRRRGVPDAEAAVLADDPSRRPGRGRDLQAHAEHQHRTRDQGRNRSAPGLPGHELRPRAVSEAAATSIPMTRSSTGCRPTPSSTV